jgi:thiol-disulfide isomerase/thioredoxin
MTSVNVGPLALPLAPLLVILAWGLSSVLLGLWVRGDDAIRRQSRDHVGYAVMLGLVVARLVHVVLNREAYAVEPWSALDIRDGGFEVLPGVAAAALGLAWSLWRARAQAWAQGAARRGVVGACGVGLAVWFGARVALAPAAMELPTMALQPLDVPSLESLATAASASLPPAPRTLAEVAAGRPMVINLWATWCGPCRAEMPAFVQAQRELGDIVFVFVNQGEDAVVAKRYLATLAPRPDHVLLDPTWSVGQAVASKSLPTTLFVNAKGMIVKRHVGMLNVAALRAETAALTRR